MDSSVALTQVCGCNAPVEAKTLDTTQDIAMTSSLSHQDWSDEAMRIKIPDLLQWIERNSNYTRKSLASLPTMHTKAVGAGLGCVATRY